MKKILAAIGAVVVLLVAYAAYRIVPRHVSLAVQRIQFTANPALGSDQTRHAAARRNSARFTAGKAELSGRCHHTRTTEPNRDNGGPVTIVLNPSMGGDMI